MLGYRAAAMGKGGEHLRVQEQETLVVSQAQILSDSLFVAQQSTVHRICSANVGSILEERPVVRAES